MWDGGSTLTFITFNKAKSLNLTGKPVKLGIEVVGGKTTMMDTKVYQMQIMREYGNPVQIEAYGLDRISSHIDQVDIRQAAKLLRVKPSEINRPSSGEIDLLIGLQYAAFHPVRRKVSGHLILMSSEFGGNVIAGSHPNVKYTPGEITQACLQSRNAIVMHAVRRVESFFEIEGLGVMCEPRCGGCKCGTCQLGGKNMSLKEEAEYHMIVEGVQFDETRGRWLANYPWVKPPEELPDNRNMAMAILRSTEKRLLRNKDHADTYNEQIHDMVRRSAARHVSNEELVNYTGGKFYISHFDVLNPKSRSTPCRIVYNSSARFQGHSLNDYLAKGPSLLNKMIGVLMRFRECKHAFIGDISKMFHSIDIPLRDQMTHLFLWRDFNMESHPATYAMTAVNMGDRPSATIAQVALRKSAELFASEYPEASNLIVKNAYMDDIPASTNSGVDATRLRGEIDFILSSTGFVIKEWICSGQDTSEVISLRLEAQQQDDMEQAEGVLGISWIPKRDMLKLEVDAVIPVQTTKRLVLSTASKLFDPHGMIAPFSVKMKILMRRIWALRPKVGWDDDLPRSVKEEWHTLTQELQMVNAVEFYRSITPNDADGKPILVMFSDGSEEAYGAVGYARWKSNNGGFVSRLIMSKTRMAPLKTIDIVRLELCGAVLSKRCRATIEAEMEMEFEKIIHLVDSEIVQAMINRESYGFNTFAANRVGEIHQGTLKSEWAWVPGKPWLNVADLTTRGCSPVELSTDSVWQQGPKFLAKPEGEWPIVRKIRSDIVVPELKQKFVGVVVQPKKETLHDRFKLARFSKWRLLVHTTARIQQLYQRYNASRESDAMQLEIAELFWIKKAQEDLDLNKLPQLKPQVVDGVVLVGGRAERWMEATWNRQRFILLPKGHAISALIVAYEHCKGGHLGLEASVAKVRSKYWILGLRQMMKQWISRCVPCKKKLKQRCEQVMSTLPIERLRPCPPFTNVGVDYFGPYNIRGEVQKRVRRKCYGVIFSCLVVRAVYIDVAVDYSTDAFLQVFRRFVSIRGYPRKIFSDNGTQLVGASNELKKAVSSLDQEKIRAFGIENGGIEWTFSPGDAPWYNGATEALVKTTKRALNTAVGDSVLSFSELQTAMLEAAQLINQRPIGSTPTTPDDGSYLCPNDLILGRASSKIPQGEFKTRNTNRHRLDFLQNIVAGFWRRWTREVFPKLVIEPKWHTERRNVKVGDVVMVEDINAVRGEWKVALVVKARESTDGKIRRVTVSYRTVAGSRQEIERAVQRIIVLVPVEESH